MWRDARWVEKTLADDSGEAQAEVMQWSATNSRTEVADTLVRVLSRNPPGPAWGGAGCSLPMMFCFISLTFGGCVSAATQNPLPLLLTGLPFVLLILRDLRRPKIARRAALLLARMNDPRAIAPLTTCWQGFHYQRDNEPLAEEITRLLNDVVIGEPPTEVGFALREFVFRRFVTATRGNAPYLPELEVEMYIACLRCIARSSAPTVRGTLDLLARIKTTEPNRSLVIEAAQVLLEPVPEPLPISATASLPPDPVQQQVIRRD